MNKNDLKADSLSLTKQKKSGLELFFGCLPQAFTSQKILCGPQVYFLPLSKVVPQFFMKGISSNLRELSKVAKEWHNILFLASKCNKRGLMNLGLSTCFQTKFDKLGLT